MPKVNWADVEEQDFSPIPEGRYEVEIDEVVTEKDGKLLTSKGGDDMWRVRFSVCEGQSYTNRKIFTNLVFNEGGYGNVKKLYSTIFGTKLPKNCTPDDILNEKLFVDVTIGEYNGKKNNSIPYAGFHASEEDDEEFN